MKFIVAIIKPYKLNEVREALASVGIEESCSDCKELYAANVLFISF